MAWFGKIAPFLTDPLVLIGFSLVILSGIFRAILVSKGDGLIPQVSKKDGATVIIRLMRYVFVLALLLILFGFSTKFYGLYIVADHVDDRYKELKQNQKILLSKIDALSQLVASLSSRNTGKINDPVADPEKVAAVCVEPSSSSLSALESVLTLGESGVSIHLRTQTIQLMRDSMYRACEALATGAIDVAGYSAIAQKYENIMVTIMAIEQLESEES